MNAGRPTDHDKDLLEIEQQYQGLAQDEPPAMLDQAVLNKARLAVEPHPTRPWSFGWMHASATAAVLVIGLTLVLQQPEKVPIPTSELNRGLPAALERDLVDSEFRLQEEIGRSNAGTVDALESADTTDADHGDADHGAFDDQSEIQTVTDPMDNNEAKLAEPARRERAAKTQPAVLFEQEKPQQEQLEAETGAEAVSTPKESYGPSERQKSDKRMDQPVSDSGLIAPAPASAPVEASAPEPALQKSKEGFAVTGQAGSDDAVGDEVMDGEDRAAEISATFAGARESSSAMRMLEPDEWIAQILELKQAGEDDAWQQELESFVAVYPDYPLPEELISGQKATQEPGGQ